MKRRDLERHLRAHRCRQVSQGSAHTKWLGPDGTSRSVVPRHREIDFKLVRAICRQLAIPPPTGPR